MNRGTLIAASLSAIATASQADATPLYRMFISGDHFYTANLEEAFNATRLGYVFEGDVGQCDLGASSGTVPLYRLYSPSGTDHFYTASSQERDLAIAAHGYQSEGIVCWVRPYQDSGTCPLYRMYSGAESDHFYTVSWNEVLYAASLGYAYEGVAGYMGFPGGCPA